jgi:hypothetical protein
MKIIELVAVFIILLGKMLLIIIVKNVVVKTEAFAFLNANVQKIAQSEKLDVVAKEIAKIIKNANVYKVVNSALQVYAKIALIQKD